MHPCTPSSWIELDANALLHNVAMYKRLIGGALLAPVIKGNAYGHGLLEVGMLCDTSSHVDMLCVFFLSEAYALRTASITKPILVMGMINEDLSRAAHHHIEFMTGAKETIEQLNAAGVLNHYRFPLHLKIDTGLSRFGILPHEASAMVAWISALPGISLVGIASHCAESQAANQTFTQRQMKTLEQLYFSLGESQKTPGKSFIYHMGNSGIASQYPRTGGSLFRLGIGTYGYWPSPDIEAAVQRENPWFTLKPMLTWKTSILAIKTVAKGTSVGYNRTFTTKRTTTLATLPVGYLDGYNPALSNKKGVVKIENSYAPIVGRVAMNTIIIDITDCIHEMTPKSTVTLIGNDPMVNASCLAAHTEFNNPRLLLTSLRADISRYVKNAPEQWKPSAQEHVLIDTNPDYLRA